MRILITGAAGQLGRDLTKLFQAAGHDVHGMDREEMDITDMACCRAVFDALRPEAVIHAAAYTAVDRAESEPDEAFRINAAGTRNVAVAAERVGAKCCYISTDYVFSGGGSSRTPYQEYGKTGPESIYGKSKLAGEQLVISLCSRWFIVRTSWVYGAHGSNFVKTMLKLAEGGEPVFVVEDQIGSPTYTVDLSDFLLELIQTELYGIYHASNTGSCTWYEFAQVIFEELCLQVDLRPCTTEQFPRPAPRPSYSVMEHMSIRTNGFRDFRHWREGLREFLKKEIAIRAGSKAAFNVTLPDDYGE